MARPFQATSSKAIQSLQSLPMPQTSICGRVLAPGQTPSAPLWKYHCFMLTVERVKTLSAPLTKIQEQKDREQQYRSYMLSACSTEHEHSFCQSDH